MSAGEKNPGSADGSPHGRLVISCDRLARNRTQVRAYLHDRLTFAHTFDINNANSRAAFAKDLAEKLESEGDESIDPRHVEAELLRIVDEAGADEDGDAPAPPRFVIVADDPDPDKNGMYEVTAGGPRQLTNFDLLIERDVKLEDGGDIRRRFEGVITLDGKKYPISLSPDELANPRHFMAAVYKAAGPRAQFYARPELVCRAVSARSHPVKEEVTNSPGWDDAGEVYRGPFGRVDAAGIHPPGADDPVRVDVSDEQCARHIGLAVPAEGEIPGLKEHVVKDLLRLTDPLVTYLLLAATALAVLFRFVPGMNRPALWVVGLTGSGKSFLGRLFANFFGDFPVADGSRLATWSSTANFIQRIGWFFKDALFFVDDFKHEVVRHADFLKVTQNYADGSSRGRLRSDSTSNAVRPIRGILVSTGEDVPEHSASALARNVVVVMPSKAKDRERGLRCVERSSRYRTLQAAFIHHLISGGRTASFAAKVKAYRELFIRGIEGRQNDERIAGNLALFAAAFDEYAAFLGDAWPDWQAERDAFVAGLMGLRDDMLAAVRDQQASEIFLDVLRTLVEFKEVRIQGHSSDIDGGPRGEHVPLIGRTRDFSTGRRGFEISTHLALRAVQEHLRRSGKPPLAATEKAIIGQLAADGRLLGRDGRQFVPAGGRPTWGVKLDGTTKNVFLVAQDTLVSGMPAGPRRDPYHQHGAVPETSAEDGSASAPEEGAA